MSDNQAASSQSLTSMMSALQILEREIDESAEISHEQCEAHFNQIKEIHQKVDRLLAYIDIAKMNAAMYSARAEEIKNAAKAWEKKQESLENYALFLASRYPDTEWHGTDRKFKKVVNEPSLKVALKKSYSAASTIPDEFVNKVVPEKYLDKVTVWKLKTDEIKDALESGEQFEWANLERKERLKITVKALPKGRK